MSFFISMNSYCTYYPCYSFRHFHMLPSVSAASYFFYLIDALSHKFISSLNIWWHSKLMTLDWINNFHLILSNPISSYLIPLYFSLINGSWLNAGRCAGYCTLTWRNLNSEVQVEVGMQMGREQRKRTLQETKSLLSGHFWNREIYRRRDESVQNVFIEVWNILPTLWETDEGCEMCRRTFETEK